MRFQILLKCYRKRTVTFSAELIDVDCTVFDNHNGFELLICCIDKRVLEMRALISETLFHLETCTAAVIDSVISERYNLIANVEVFLLLYKKSFAFTVVFRA